MLKRTGHIYLNRKFHILALVVGLVFLSISTIAQPSGGPYGPIHQKYELPDVNGTIYYVAPNGLADNSGESLDKPTTIETAIEKVATGDAIVMRGGTYRTGNLILNQGITIQPYQDEKPIIKGTYVATEWQDLGNGLWTTHWDHLFPSKPQDWWRRNREGKKTPQHRFNNDMVFVNGRYLQSAGWEGEVDENTHFIDYETGTVYIGVNPTDKLVEITAFNVAILRTTKEAHGKVSDKQGYHLKGLTISQYAYRALEVEGTEPNGISSEDEHGKEVIGTTIENCEISYCSRVAGYLRGDGLTIRNCKVSDTSTEGIYIIASSDVLLEKNIFRKNNIERITGYYPAAVKIFNQTRRVMCRDNLVIDLPYSNGIWYDVGNVDGVFINNWVEGVGFTSQDVDIDKPWPSRNGFFFEISKGAICAGNVFVNCDHGVWALNSSDVQFYQNTFVNSMAVIGRDARSAEGDHFGWHPATGPGVEERDGHVFVNNLLVGDENFDRALLTVWQPPIICDRVTNSPLKEIDNNVYVRGKKNASHPLIYWSPADNEECRLRIDSPEVLNKLYPEFSSNSKYYPDYVCPLFQSQKLENYQLLSSFPGIEVAKELPAEIEELINQKGNYIGAFPPLK